MGPEGIVLKGHANAAIGRFLMVHTSTVEVDMAFDEGADAVVASGLASVDVIDKFIYEAKRLGIYAIVDTMNVDDPIKKLKSLKELPDIVILHRAIDAEKREKHRNAELKRELEQIRKTGVAVNIGQAFVGGEGIASIIRDSSGRAIAAIVISSPSARMNDTRRERFATLIKMATSLISFNLGYNNEPNPTRDRKDISAWWEQSEKHAVFPAG